MRIVTGVRPTGELHIGNYLNTVKQYVPLQEKNECIFFIADLHGITTPHDSQTYFRNVFEKAIDILATGLDPEKCIIYFQSQLKEVTELAWLLGTVTPIGDLRRMTQFKEKSKQNPQYINAGLLNYPILMAADILLYQTELVPVGEDQEQHVELARTIARKFNQKFGETFNVPEAKLQKLGARIMSLQNPTKKMSKTDSQESYIGIFDEPEEIKKKIMSAVTDTGKQIKYNLIKKPGISNLLTIYSSFSGKTIKELEIKFKNKGYSELKKTLTELLINYLEPFRRKRKELLSREVYVNEILEQGRKRARIIAESTMSDVMKKIGLS
jgi:tryptophanyl-tRNA synthetase